MKGLGILSDFDLVVAYEKAVKLELDREFIEILLVELDRREIRNHTLSIC
jgi:Sporulation inhibitor A